MKLDTPPNYAESASDVVTTPGTLTPIGSPPQRPSNHVEAEGLLPEYTIGEPTLQDHERESVPDYDDSSQRSFPSDQKPLIYGFYSSRLYDTNVPREKSCCQILPTRSAVCIGRGSAAHVRLSTLAAAILVKEGLIQPKDLDLYPASSEPEDNGPTDPISGVLGATHGVVGGVVEGLIDYPREVTRMLKNDLPVAKGMAATFALDSNKGLSRIIGTGLKAPMDITLGVSRGFYNMPKLYGDEVRRQQRVTGLGSGLQAAGKGFGLGLWDGVTGIVTQPVKGARKGGVLGGLKGFGRGIGGVVCKPAAGAIGLPAYAFKGAYESIRSARGVTAREHEAEIAAALRQGEQAMEGTTSETEFVVRRWLEIQSL